MHSICDWEAAALGPRHDPRPMRRGVWASREEEEVWLQASAETREGGETLKCGESSGKCDGLSLKRKTEEARGQGSVTGRGRVAASTSGGEVGGAESGTGKGGKILNRDDGNVGIPKIIHQIWLGSARPSSSKYMAWFASWITHHPGWAIRWWHDADVVALRQRGEFRNARAFDAAENFGEKSDILRYEILLRHGGLYVDTDMECLASFERLHKGGHSVGNGHLSFYTGFSNTATVELNNGIIGSVPGHSILRKLVDSISKLPPRKVKPELSGDYCPRDASASGGVEMLGGMIYGHADHGTRNNVNGLLASMLGGGETSAKLAEALKPGEPTKWAKCMSTIERTGPGLFTRIVLGYLASPKCGDSAAKGADGGAVVVLPSQAFYPVPNTVSVITPEILNECSHKGVTLAVHHWAKSWQREEAESKLSV